VQISNDEKAKTTRVCVGRRRKGIENVILIYKENYLEIFKLSVTKQSITESYLNAKFFNFSWRLNTLKISSSKQTYQIMLPACVCVPFKF